MLLTASSSLSLAIETGQGTLSPRPLPKVPDGFMIELVAGPSLVEHPTMAGFDDRGRLYVCDGPGMNMPAKELLEKLPNQIRRLEDRDGDGRFDASTTFADKMTFPMGAAWHAGSIYTASPPNIWKLTDSDDDGIADVRQVLVSEFGFTGNAADIHGCFVGPDGRIYWCDGRHGHNFVDENGNQISKGLAARVFSCRADGKDVESFAGGGMDNPVELCFTDEGEPIGTAAIFDVVDGRHDALVHWVYGGVYPRYEQPCLKEFRRTGPLLPPLSRMLGVAPSGIARYRSRGLGDEFHGNLFHAQFNTHTVVRSCIERAGATFRSTDEPFLTSDDSDFHPTDVLEDADGSLLVIDTGGWFRIGCPTSQIAKPEILGGIYRIRRTGAKTLDDPRGMKLDWVQCDNNELIRRLSDERPAVVDRAVETLVSREEASVASVSAFVAGSESAAAGGRALWILARRETPEARAALRRALDDKVASSRQIAALALGKLRDADAYDALLAHIAIDESPVRREAATALGRLGRKSAVPKLLEAVASSAGDRFLEHALIYAIIQLDDPAATSASLSHTSPAVRRAALIALDQMPHGDLRREQVGPLLATDDAALRDAALDVIERHEGWAGDTTDLLARWLSEQRPTDEQISATQTVLLRFTRDEKVQSLVTAALADAATSQAARVMLLEVIARADLGELPAPWIAQLMRSLASEDPVVVRQALAAAGRSRVAELEEPIAHVAHSAKLPEPVRIAALFSLGRRGCRLDTAGFEALTRQLTQAEAALDRLAAAEALGSAALDDRQRKALVPYLEAAGPLELPALARAFDKQTDAELGRSLVAALEKSPGTENLTADRFKQLFAAYPNDVQSLAAALQRRMNVDIVAQRQRLTEVAAGIDGGNAARGKKIFFGNKATCSACHRAGKDGGAIGPELTKVGQIRSRMDLLESLLYPSASFVRGYESYQVLTAGGQSITGIVSRETPDAVYLRTAQKEEIRVARSEIEELAPSKLSIMPQGLDRLLSHDELRDVVAFLQSLK
ncbi:MAG TPA: PVC-type heme-binding CxxCH protein [Pirellulales bacterium]|nr:PVC-type heme-binding CxxCH protein [Pirellulales bacterium]